MARLEEDQFLIARKVIPTNEVGPHSFVAKRLRLPFEILGGPGTTHQVWDYEVDGRAAHGKLVVPDGGVLVQIGGVNQDLSVYWHAIRLFFGTK